VSTIIDVRCRIFSCAATETSTVHANPLRAWAGEEGGERAFRFHEWLVVEIELADGVVGTGNAALAPRVAAAIITDDLVPVVVGRAVMERENLWQRMFRAIVTYGRCGVGMAALSAVDIALWDATGKLLGVPVYDLMGGLKRPAVPVYASQLYPTHDLDALAAEARGYADEGFGMVKQRLLAGPADGTAGMRRNVELVRTVREAVGPDVDMAADVYMGWDLEYAQRMVRLLEPFNLRWLEEPLLPNDLGGYRALRSASPIPIAGGEHEATLHGFHELISTRAVDIIQPDVNRVGGLTVAQKICAVAEATGTPVVPHAGQLHNYHLVASQPACPIAEFFPVNSRPAVGNEIPHLLFAGEPVAKAGHIELSGEPGLGVSVDPRAPVRELRLAS
jgi:L-lyxonate dehydratase